MLFMFGLIFALIMIPICFIVSSYLPFGEVNNMIGLLFSFLFIHIGLKIMGIANQRIYKKMVDDADDKELMLFCINGY